MQPTERKEINRLDYVVTNHVNKNKNKRTAVIENEPRFDNTVSLSSRSKDPQH